MQISGSGRYIKNTSWLLFERILRMLVILVISVYTARFLGPGKFGLLSYAQSFVGLFMAFSTLGLEGIVIHELVLNDDNRDTLLGTSFILQVLGTIVLISLILVSVQLIEIDPLTKILIIIIAASLFAGAFRVINFFFQSIVQSKFVVYAQIVALLFSLGGTFVLISAKAEILWFAILILFESAVLSLGLIVNYSKQRYLLSSWKFDKTVAKELLQKSWPLILSGLVISMYMKIDQLMINSMLGNDAVGLYASAVRLSESWYFVPMVIAGSVFPAIIKAKNKSAEIYHSRLQMLYDLMVLIAVAIALPITFFSDWIIVTLYGQEFIKAGSVLTIHIWACVFFFLGAANGRWLIIEGYTKIAFARNLLGAVINIVLNLLLIPSMGITGSAMATLVALLFSSHLYFIFHKKTRFMFKMQTLSFFIFFRLNRKLWKIPSRS
jgi:O-antigen/teichoic acid export membrane protein